MYYILYVPTGEEIREKLNLTSSKGYTTYHIGEKIQKEDVFDIYYKLKEHGEFVRLFNEALD